MKVERSRSPVVTYHRLRLLRFEGDLLAFARRWVSSVTIALAVFVAGSNAPLAIAAAAVGGLVGPLFAAAMHGGWIVPATVAYALVGALPVVATRSLWWPRAWALAERALPIEPGEIRRSDRIFAAFVSLPWFALIALGWVAAAAGGVAPGGTVGIAGVALVVATLGSQWLAARWMRFVRRTSVSRSRGSGRVRIRAAPYAFRRVGVVRALVLWPLLRGRAPRTVVALVAALTANAAIASDGLWSPMPGDWSLALLALASLVATSLLRASTARELQPLWRDHRALPLDTGFCEGARASIVLAPALAGAAVCLACAAGRSTVVAYALVVALGCGIEATSRETMRPSHRAARWILMLAVMIAVGSEVAPS